MRRLGIPLGVSAFLALIVLFVAGCKDVVETQPNNPSATDISTATDSITAESSKPSAAKSDNATSDNNAKSDNVVSAITETADKEAATETLEVTLQKVSFDQYQQIIKDQAGKVVLVDFWATWCLPCIQQFPHTLELAEKHRPEGLAVISMSCDKPTEEAKVLEFLKKKNSHVMNLLTDSDYSTTSEQYDIRGGNPYYLLYDRQGNLRYRFSSQASEEDETEAVEQIDACVAELLAEPAE